MECLLPIKRRHTPSRRLKAPPIKQLGESIISIGHHCIMITINTAPFSPPNVTYNIDVTAMSMVRMSFYSLVDNVHRTPSPDAFPSWWYVPMSLALLSIVRWAYCRPLYLATGYSSTSPLHWHRRCTHTLIAINNEFVCISGL